MTAKLESGDVQLHGIQKSSIILITNLFEIAVMQGERRRHHANQRVRARARVPCVIGEVIQVCMIFSTESFALYHQKDALRRASFSSGG